MKLQGHSDLIKARVGEVSAFLRRWLVKTWNDYGQFGQFIDVDNGKWILTDQQQVVLPDPGWPLLLNILMNRNILRSLKLLQECIMKGIS